MSERASAAAGAPRRSLILRYTLAYASIFFVAIAGVLGFLYWSALVAQERAIDASIAAEAESLRPLGVAQVKTVVERRLSDPAGRTWLYRLETAREGVVVGNLAGWPAGVPAGGGPVEFALGASRGAVGGARDEGAAASADGVGGASGGAGAGGAGAGAAGAASASGASGAMVRGQVLRHPSGGLLFVGRDVTDLERLRVRILYSLGWALGITALLGVAGGYALSRRVAARLDAINRQSEAILGGDLARRMPTTGSGDEFDALAANLNRMLDRLSALMQAMRHVADDIAHDMRSPISRLRSRIEVALMGPADAATYRQALEQTVKDADEILAMFNALLTIALAESGEPRDRFVEIDLAAVAREAAEAYEPLAEEKGVALDVEAPGAVNARGEPRLVAQAIGNLLDNAVKYVPRGGRIEVRVARRDGAAEVVVADDGPGIPEEFRSAALERFSRLEASRSTPGSGLGLSLVRAVAELHGAELMLEDNRPGLRVALRFPATRV